MTGRRGGIDEFSFAAEGLTATAAAAALRRVRSLADQAPSGRMFAAIATLSEMSKAVGSRLEAGHAALIRGEADTATGELASAIVGMDRMAAAAQPVEDATPLPAYLRQK